MQLISSAFLNNQPIPKKYSCEGEGIHPPLEIIAVPEATKSLALIVDDPDAPSGTFVHWLVWNIPPTTTKIGENKIPEEAIEGRNSSKEVGFIAPCPPSGMHHYRFILWALSQSLSLTEEATREKLESTLAQFVLEKAELVGTYQKK